MTSKSLWVEQDWAKETLTWKEKKTEKNYILEKLLTTVKVTNVTNVYLL